MKTFTLILGLFLISLNVQAQKVITVDNRANTGADYASLSDAVAAAFVGDTIQIHPSASAYGNANTGGKRLIFVGLSHNPANSKVNEKAKIGTITFTGNSANSLVTGLEVNIINTSAVTDVTGIKIINNMILSFISGSNSVASNDWLIEGNILDGAYIQPNLATNDWVIKNNIFDNTTQYPIVNTNDQISFLNNIVVSSSGNFANACEDTIVSNNIFILEGSITEVKLNNSTVVFSNNLTRNVQGQTVNSLSGNNNLDNTDPGFTFAFGDIDDYYNNDYNVTGSAATGGIGGTAIGVFGTGFNFDVDGRPDDFPYMTSLDISNPSVPMGENINVTFTAAKKN